MPDERRNSLDLAHEYIPISYDWMLSRIASIEARVDTLMAQSAAILVAAVVAVTAINEGTIPTGWALAAGGIAVVLFLIITILGIRARNNIKLHMTNPGSFVLEHPEAHPTTIAQRLPYEFIVQMLREAGKDAVHNTKIVNDTGTKCERMGWALVGELLASLSWVGLSPIF